MQSWCFEGLVCRNRPQGQDSGHRTLDMSDKGAVRHICCRRWHVVLQSWESLIFPLMTGLGSEALKSTLCSLLLAQGFVSQAFKNKLDSRSVNLCRHGKGCKDDSVPSILPLISSFRGDGANFETNAGFLCEMVCVSCTSRILQVAECNYHWGLTWSPLIFFLFSPTCDSADCGWCVCSHYSWKGSWVMLARRLWWNSCTGLSIQ